MKEFNRLFEQLAYRNSVSKVFDDFLTLCLCAFSMGRCETLYLETLKGYTPDEIKIFPQLLGALVNYYQSKSLGGGWVDGLGEFFEEHNGKFGRDALGQFFTPPQICDLIAQLTGNKTGMIQDPAAGSGRCLIAADRLDPDNRLRNFYIAADIDARCVKMCAVNMFLYGMKGAVIHMDSIKYEFFKGYRVYLAETGLGVQPISAHECRQLMTESRQPTKQPEPEAQTPKPKQLKLFEILSR